MEDLLSEEQTCANCFFWLDNVELKGKGECRRNAPLPRISETKTCQEYVDQKTQWPLTCNFSWCGEWKEIS